MYIKVKDQWIEVVDESTNGVEHIYYDADGNGYYDYEVEETTPNRPLTVKDLNESFKKMYNEYKIRDSEFGLSNAYTWDVVNRVPTASNEMQDVKITTSGGSFAQINSFAPASVKVISEADLKQMYQPVSKPETKTRRSKKKKV